MYTLTTQAAPFFQESTAISFLLFLILEAFTPKKIHQKQVKNKINIAIDGHSSCGKGTLAKYLATELGYKFIDTGAMYRAVTYALTQDNTELDDTDAIKTLLAGNSLAINFVPNTQNLSITFNGQHVEEEIRLPSVSNRVSQVSELAVVRTYLVQKQQQMAEGRGIVMDGRDIGTHVLPNAELKIFMTADAQIRAQ